MKHFGLIGFPLGHSFSKGYFTQKFEELGIASTHSYELYPIEKADLIQDLFRENPDLGGLNVTIPHKLGVLPLLSSLDTSAEMVGAVNVIKKMKDGSLKGYNSDYYGFLSSLEAWLPTKELSALTIGNGGAAKAVHAALGHLGIPYTNAVRTIKADGEISLNELNEEHFKQHRLIINNTPLGTFPNTDACPNIPYEWLNKDHLLYDLVYNPTETLFLKHGISVGARVKNGYEMLVNQAEKAWEIWNA